MHDGTFHRTASIASTTHPFLRHACKRSYSDLLEKLGIISHNNYFHLSTFDFLVFSHVLASYRRVRNIDSLTTSPLSFVFLTS